MDERTLEVGRRIRSLLPPDMTQGALARAAEMTPDAMSRALNGQRGFSMLELTAIAHTLDADLHWLITGQPDPHRLSVAARHNWDPTTRTRSNPGREADEIVIAKVQAIYHAAYPDGAPPSAALGGDAASLREQLGGGFVRRFAEVAEERFGIDVVRMAGLSTAYSMAIGARNVILLPAHPWWFRSNWSLAHEIGHLALGHHDNDSASDKAKEDAADTFAAKLLLPKPLLGKLDWTRIALPELADFLWLQGVSSVALHNRLTFLRLAVDDGIDAVLQDTTTPRLLATYGTGLRAKVEERKQEANARRMPLSMLAALTERVESGSADPELLAWALDVPLDELDFPEPDSATAAEHYRLATTAAPDADEIGAWLAAQDAQ